MDTCERLPMDDLNDLTLMELNTELQDAFTDMANEFLDQEGTLARRRALDDFPSFVQGLLDEALPEKVKPGRVPCTHLWLVSDDMRLIGTSNLRHWLVPQLEREGGHIAYAVRPSERRKGYGTRLLALTLQRAWAMGLQRVLITCDEDNVGSRKVIEANGGKLVSRGISERIGRSKLRYWIDRD